jgi:nitroimidazol reductase NimA-like FMN-containing flavoprotein (pyridoxamine 5'-phosphate oxidase superfamily)
MLGELNPDEIDRLLTDQLVGRIGCQSNGVVYIVPVTYAYDGMYIYAHSKEGMKIQMMRKNPMVCFEVDRMENNANWQSAIVWGRYEEMKGTDQKLGLHKLLPRIQSLTASETATPDASDQPHQNENGPYKSVVYRIKVLEKSGRFEKK